MTAAESTGHRANMPGKYTPTKLETSGRPFSAFSSACPLDGSAVANRMDPYWDDVWAVGSVASFVSAENASKQVAAGRSRMPGHLSLDAEAAHANFTEYKFSRKLSVISALDSWTTLTCEQLSAFVGDKDVATGKSQLMSELFAMGLVDVGIFSNGLYNTRNTPRGSLYRPSKTTVYERLIQPTLTYPEQVSITGGYKRGPVRQHDRHNVLAAELGLRVAELCDVGSVVGERYSRMDLLTGAKFKRQSPEQQAADLTIIRPDGMKIAVEVTATIDERRFISKVERWAKILAKGKFAGHGTMVLFLIASRPEQSSGAIGRIRNLVYKTVQNAVRDYSGFTFDRTASRIAVADWQEWFPSRGTVSTEFTSLGADLPTGPAGARWERQYLLDPFDTEFTPADPTSATAVLNNLSMARSVPHWLRNSQAPEVWQTLLAESDFDEIPVPIPARPELSAFHGLGEGVGASGDTRPAPRMRSNWT